MLYFTTLQVLSLNKVKRAGLFVRPTLSSDKRVPWSHDRTCLLSICKNFKKQLFSLLECLKSRPVVLDFEGFRHKKSGFIIKELAVAVSTEFFCDTVSFLPQTSFNILSSIERRSYSWVSKYLHGLKWEIGDYPYCYLQQIFDSIALRFPLATFYAKGTEKTETLQKLLKKNVINLEILLCPKIENLKFFHKTPICTLHGLSCPKRQRNKHCARKKAELFYLWLTNESTVRKSSIASTSSELVPKFSGLELYSG